MQGWEKRLAYSVLLGAVLLLPACGKRGHLVPVDEEGRALSAPKTQGGPQIAPSPTPGLAGSKAKSPPLSIPERSLPFDFLVD